MTMSRHVSPTGRTALVSGTTAIALVSALAGCSFSGYDAGSSFACKAPSGVLCNSMSGIYANAMAHNLPEQRVHAGSGEMTNLALGSGGAGGDSDSASGTARAPLAGLGGSLPPAGILPQALDSGAPIRTAPREMRVWVAPWQDADTDLHDQEYLYLIVNEGHWSIAHNQGRIRAAFRPVLPPREGVPPSAPSPVDGPSTTDRFDGPSQDGAAKARQVMGDILTPDGAIDRAAAQSPNSSSANALRSAP
ncbi:type IV conjugative transfer system lipoprotein TraV [Burkholderia glumae]|uniref:type IV conjugative transfer system lipoprotein TraV n=1 Tax=Burkholderia glumae TaxID=337 RepID=UPI0020C66B5F|nr:type IV conjugative transfer system lipoprotein TraV [Burkholderia glumae]